MTTRTPDELMDERLRAAGTQLRRESPSPAETDAALADVNRRGRAVRPLRWVVPVGIVASAAAALGVLAVSRGADEAEPEGPAVTPPVTAEPTVPATSAPSDPPVFVGNPSLSASAAVFGCPGTLGEIAAATSTARHPITGVACAGDVAVVATVDGSTTGLRRQADGTWAQVQPGEDVFIDALPIPPASLLVRDLGDLPPVAVTRRVRRQAALVQVSEPDQFANSLGARLADGDDPAPAVTAEVVDGADVFIITLSGLADDSVGEVTYVVWYDPAPPVPTVELAFLISRCLRGVAVDEAGESMDLCV